MVTHELVASTLTMENGSTGDAGDIYSGLDRFGRLIETIWKTGSTDLVHTKYGRNRVGGVVWQLNVKAHASSVATQDNFYWYDGLQQVTRHDRGDLTSGSGPPYTGIDPSTRQQMEVFTFDETGNWPGYFSQSPSLTQSRAHNPSNQITSISGPTGAVQPAYDPAGNMTRMPRPGDWSAAAELTWDAWNRLVKLRTPSSPSSSSSGSSSSASSSSDSSSSASGSSSSSGSASSSGSGSSSSGSSSSGSSSSGSSSSGSPASLEITYQYDALTRRTRKTNGAGTIDYYYDRQWRSVEERTAGTVTAQYVWSPLDRWTMIRRKRSVAGTLDETRYVLKDYLDPAAVIDTSAAVVERFGFDAFGPVRFMDAAFATRSASTTGWNFLFHAEFLDADSGLYNYGYRYLHPQLGRWLSRDPIAEKGGMNLYGFVGNDGVKKMDVLGLRPPDFTLKNCTIIVFGGHGIGYLEGDDKPVARKRTNASDIPYRIHTPPCSAATAVSCNADRITVIDNPLPNFPPTSGNPGYVVDVTGAGIFCDLMQSAIDAAKSHAVTICNKEQSCCKKVKIEARILGDASCKIVPGGYKGWVHDCATGVTTEGDK